MKPREIFITIAIVIIALTFGISLFWKPVLWLFVITSPLILVGISDIFNKKNAIKNNFPVIGHLRYVLESFRQKIHQYFVETDIEGTTIHREFRSLTYQRAKKLRIQLLLVLKEMYMK